MDTNNVELVRKYNFMDEVNLYIYICMKRKTKWLI